MAKRKERVAVADKALIDEAEGLVRHQRSLPRSKLPRWKELTAEAQEQLVEALLSRGLEAGDKGALRLPLHEQIGLLAQGGARLPWKGVAKRIAGASTSIRDGALATALGGGVVRLVVRTKVDTVVGGREDVLAPDEVERLVKAHHALGAVLKLVGKKVSPRAPLSAVRKTLLRQDAADLLAPLLSVRGAARPERPSDPAAVVLDLLRQMERPPVLLVWVPDLVRALAPLMTTEQALGALLSARQSGLIELRPESGVGRLSPQDAASCPRDADGLPLSHARRLSAG